MVVPNSAGGPVHLPVLRDRIVDLLAPALSEPGSIYLDCTLGLGGHAAAVLDACPQARLIGIDRDPAALELACLLYTSPSPRDGLLSRMPSSA